MEKRKISIIKGLRIPIILFVFFWTIAIVFWQLKDEIIYLFNFGYIGTALTFGVGSYDLLPRKKKPSGRRIAQLLIGPYLLGYLGFYKYENMQIEGFFFYLLGGFFGGLNLLEFVCGTGYWTQFACKSTRSIVAMDYNNEVFDIAREKDYGGCPITFIKASAYTLDGVNGPFSAALVGFWWSYVPKTKLDDFLEVLHSKLSKGANTL